VEITGEKKDPCTNATSSAAFCVWLMLFAVCIVVFFCFLFSTSIQGLVSVSVGFCGSCACHKLLGFVHVLCRTVLLLCVMVTSMFVKVAVHCASQSCPTERSDVLPRFGNMCPVRASKGKFGKSNSAVWVAIIVSLFGNIMLIPFGVLFLFLYGAVTAKKWPVHPVSTIMC